MLFIEERFQISTFVKNLGTDQGIGSISIESGSGFRLLMTKV
jgi:hypothetical protein